MSGVRLWLCSPVRPVPPSLTLSPRLLPHALPLREALQASPLPAPGGSIRIAYFKGVLEGLPRRHSEGPGWLPNVQLFQDVVGLQGVTQGGCSTIAKPIVGEIQHPKEYVCLWRQAGKVEGISASWLPLYPPTTGPPQLCHSQWMSGLLLPPNTSPDFQHYIGPMSTLFVRKPGFLLSGTEQPHCPEGERETERSAPLHWNRKDVRTWQ